MYFPNRPDRRNGNPCLAGTGNTTACGPPLQIARHRRDSSAHYPANRVASSWVDSSASGSALCSLQALHVVLDHHSTSSLASTGGRRSVAVGRR